MAATQPNCTWACRHDQDNLLKSNENGGGTVLSVTLNIAWALGLSFSDDVRGERTDCFEQEDDSCSDNYSLQQEGTCKHTLSKFNIDAL